MPASSVDAPPPAPRHATTETASPSAATLRASTRAPLPMHYARVVSAPEVSDSTAPPPQTSRHAAPALTPATLRTAFEGMQALKGVFGVLAPETATLGLASSSSSSSSASASAPASWTPKAVHARNDAPSSSRSSSSSDPAPSSSSNPTPSASSSNPNPSTSSDLPPSSSFPAKNEDYGDIPTNKQLQESLDALFAAYRHQVPRRMAAMQRPQPIPEKCFTWCSQRNDGSPMCRMMCLRRRPPLPTKEESLARLRPGASAEASTASVGFFAGLRNRLIPYSLIFVKGTPEGVVGRYMEELEGDDGQYDFGPLSRHAPYALRRKSTGHVEYLDWGADVGYILQVPLTSLFAPIINLPENVARVLGPSTRLLERAVGTITDGTQARAIEKLAEEIQRGSAVEMLGRIQTHYVKKMVEAQERQREARARAEEAVDAAQTKGATGVKPPVKDKEGKGE